MSRIFVVPNKLGLHLRSAVLLARTAARFKSDIRVKKDDNVSNGKSNLGLMMLAAAQGEELTVNIVGMDAADAMRAIEELFHSKFGED